MTKAYLNALAEEGTREDLIRWLVKLDKQRDKILKEIERLKEEAKSRDTRYSQLRWKWLESKKEIERLEQELRRLRNV